MLEAILQVLGEFLLQVIGEALFEMGLHVIAEPFRKAPNPWLAGIGYAVLGAICGGVSLLAFPVHLTPDGVLRIANLIVTPAAAGGLMSAIGAWRARRGQALFRIDQFSYGYIFALALALVRLVFAK